MNVRIALAQMNPTVGDLERNATLAKRVIAEAKRRRCSLVAFPEMMLCGYPPEDLLLKRSFLEDCERTLRRLAREARGIAVLIGAPAPAETPRGRPSNACRLLVDGRIAATYRKISLPNYGVFDEQRYFEQGWLALVARFGRVPIGVNICEDIWVDGGPAAAETALGGARIVVNLSASPYHRGKGRERERLMQRRAREYGCWLCYLNLVGGQDELVFDGCSVVADPAGRTIARGKQFEEDLVVVDIDPAADAPPRRSRARAAARHIVEIVDLPPLRPIRGAPARHRVAPHPRPIEEVYRALVLGTRDYVTKNAFSGVVLGMSGGVDSALVGAIAADAIGSARVVAVTMPSPFTSPETLRDAREVCRNLGVRMIEAPIRDIYESFLDTMSPVFAGRRADVAEENIQARIRGTILMALSNKFGWLVLTTGNKSELATGYCTLYGDMAGGFSVIKDVPKTLVYPLCRYRNAAPGGAVIPRSILRRSPTAELRPGQRDEDTLPPYPVLDRIIELYVERDRSFDDIVGIGIDRATARRAIRLIDGSEYKRRQGAPGIKITPKSFGRDRRLPITNRYRGTDHG